MGFAQNDNWKIESSIEIHFQRKKNYNFSKKYFALFCGKLDQWEFSANIHHWHFLVCTKPQLHEKNKRNPVRQFTDKVL